MIKAINVYRCICEKCKGEWTSKDATIPATCAKCRSVKWNTESAPKESTLADRVKELSRADRLALFDMFELCCGMDRGECICEPESIETAQKDVEAVPVVQDSVAAFIAQAQAKKGITQAPVITPAEIVEEWQFTADRATHNGDIDVWLREQFLVSNPKKRRKVEVSEWDHNEMVRII